MKDPGGLASRREDRRRAWVVASGLSALAVLLVVAFMVRQDIRLAWLRRQAARKSLKEPK